MDENEIFSHEDASRTRRVGDEPASEAVVRAVAEARDRDPLDLPPLHNVVDPEALDELFAETVSGDPREGHLTFDYGGCTVALLGPDKVLVDVND